MIVTKIATLIGVAALLKFSNALPDSAGVVEMVNGLAYGGIPYGSVTGMLAKHPLQDVSGSRYYYTSPVVQAQSTASYSASRVVITPNVRAVGAIGRQQGPVQIYNLPGVVAPRIVGRFNQIGY